LARSFYKNLIVILLYKGVSPYLSDLALICHYLSVTYQAALPRCTTHPRPAADASAQEAAAT